jgi:nucleotide-binding universal stress UspA family protein
MNIVCGVTGSAHAQKAAIEAAALAQKNKAELTYVFAVDTAFLRSRLRGTFMGIAQEGLERLGRHILDHAEQLAKSREMVPTKILRKGPILVVLKQVVREVKADLLVLGYEKRTFFEKLLCKGTVEEQLEMLKIIMRADVTVIQ